MEHLAALDESLAPDQLFHRLRRLHPRSTGFAPTWRAGNRFFKAELIGERRGVEECFLPFGGHVNQTRFHELRRVKRRVEVLKTPNTHTVHPFQVQLDTRFGNVAVHPVPPDARLSGCGRILESAFERIASARTLAQAIAYENQQRHSSRGKPECFIANALHVVRLRSALGAFRSYLLKLLPEIRKQLF